MLRRYQSRPRAPRAILSCLVLVLALTIVLTPGFNGRVAAAAPDFGPTPTEVISVPYLADAPYYSWSVSDRAYLQGVWGAAPADILTPASTAALIDLAAVGR
ncbi:MAG TPA: hypothetical protein VGL40_04145 [Bacillota bacterium]|jgi:hypothetical protein